MFFTPNGKHCMHTNKHTWGRVYVIRRNDVLIPFRPWRHTGVAGTIYIICIIIINETGPGSSCAPKTYLSPSDGFYFRTVNEFRNQLSSISRTLRVRALHSFASPSEQSAGSLVEKRAEKKTTCKYGLP